MKVRRRKHGLLAKTKQQIYEERIDRAAKMGTYKTGIAVVEEQEETNNTQRSSTAPKTKVRPRCGKKEHATTRSVKGLFHHEWIETHTKKESQTTDANKEINENIILANKNDNNDY